MAERPDPEPLMFSSVFSSLFPGGVGLYSSLPVRCGGIQSIGGLLPLFPLCTLTPRWRWCTISCQACCLIGGAGPGLINPPAFTHGGPCGREGCWWDGPSPSSTPRSKGKALVGFPERGEGLSICRQREVWEFLLGKMSHRQEGPVWMLITRGGATVPQLRQ